MTLQFWPSLQQRGVHVESDHADYILGLTTSQKGASFMGIEIQVFQMEFSRAGCHLTFQNRSRPMRSAYGLSIYLHRLRPLGPGLRYQVVPSRRNLPTWSECPHGESRCAVARMPAAIRGCRNSIIYPMCVAVTGTPILTRPDDRHWNRQRVLGSGHALERWLFGVSQLPFRSIWLLERQPPGPGSERGVRYYHNQSQGIIAVRQPL